MLLRPWQFSHCFLTKEAKFSHDSQFDSQTNTRKHIREQTLQPRMKFPDFIWAGHLNERWLTQFMTNIYWASRLLVRLACMGLFVLFCFIPWGATNPKFVLLGLSSHTALLVSSHGLAQQIFDIQTLKIYFSHFQFERRKNDRHCFLETQHLKGWCSRFSVANKRLIWSQNI